MVNLDPKGSLASLPGEEDPSRREDRGEKGVGTEGEDEDEGGLFKSRPTAGHDWGAFGAATAGEGTQLYSCAHHPKGRKFLPGF